MNDEHDLPPGVRAYLSGFAARARRVAVARGTGIACAAFLGWAAACCAADRYAHLPGWARAVLLAGGAGGAVVLGGRAVARAGGRGDDWADTARRVEGRSPAFGQRLVTVTSLLLDRPEFRGSDAIFQHLTYDVDRQAAGENPAALLPLRAAGLPWAGVAVAAVGLVGLARLPGLDLPRLGLRFLAPWADVPPVTTTRITVLPGDRDVAQGSPLQVEALVDRLGDAPVWLLTSDGGPATRSAMNWAGGRRFTFALGAVDRDLSYSVAGGDAESPRYAVRVLRRPAVAQFRVGYTYPPYTGKPPRAVVNADGAVEAPAGTEVDLTVTATEPLQSALLAVGGEKKLMDRAGADHRRRARFTVSKDGPYSVDLISTREQAGSGPAGMAVRAIPDRPPAVRAWGPSGVPQLGPWDVLPVAYEAVDDYGVASVSVVARVGTRPAVEVPVEVVAPVGVAAVPAGSSIRRVEGVCRIDLATAPLGPGDVLTLVVTARDVAGGIGRAEPVQVLIVPRPIDPGRRALADHLDSAAGLAEALVADDRPPERGGGGGPGPRPPGRRSGPAAGTTAALRRALLRAAARSDAPLAAAVAAWIDVVQVESDRVQTFSRSRGGFRRDRQPPGDAVRALAAELRAVADGERAAVVSAERENAAVVGALPSPADPTAAERRRVLLQLIRDDADAATARLLGPGSSADAEARLRQAEAAARTVLAGKRPPDFAAAAADWVARLRSDPTRAGRLDERLAAAALAEGLRPDADAARAFALQRAAGEAAAVVAATAGGRGVSPAAADALITAVTTARGEVTPPVSSVPAATTIPAAPLREAAELLAAAASAEAAAFHFSAAAALDEALFRLPGVAGPTTRPGATPPPTTGPADAAEWRARQGVRLLMAGAEHFHALLRRQQELTSAAGGAGGPPAGRQAALAADVGPPAGPAGSPAWPGNVALPFPVPPGMADGRLRWATVLLQTDRQLATWAGWLSVPAETTLGPAAADARLWAGGAVAGLRRECARALDDFVGRDPAGAAGGFARSAAALARTPPDEVTARRFQRAAEAALARARDVWLRAAAAKRLAVLPSLRAVVPPADVPDAPEGTGSPPTSGPAAGGRPAEARPSAPGSREAPFPDYETAIDLYFRALGRHRGGE